MSQTPNQARAAGTASPARTIADWREHLQQHPEDASAHNELGVLYYQQGRQGAALDCFRRATELDPRHARAHSNLGACFNDRGRNGEAITCYEKALDIDPRLTDAWGNLAKLWNETREFEKAVFCYDKALKLQRRPNYIRGLAMAYRQSGRFTRARELLREAIALQADDPVAHFALAPLHFYLEDYPEALREYEWRWHLDAMVEHRHNYPALFAPPAYDGEDLSGKTVLVHTEQGFGDSLLYARFLPRVIERAGQVVIWCWPGLVELFRHNFDVSMVTGKVEELPAVDCQLPLLSTPLHFDPNLEAMTGFHPYLSAPEGRKLPGSGGNRLRVGIAWGCDTEGFDYAWKKVPLEELAPLLDMEGVQWYSLQVGKDRRDLASFVSFNRIEDIGRNLTGFHQTAAAIDQLDLVISVDTAVAHLAGAMGKPTWVLLKKNPDWRWFGYGEHPLWYPHVHLYHQYAQNDWYHVVRRMARDLGHLVTQYREAGRGGSTLSGAGKR